MKKILRRKDLLYPELSYKIIGCAFDVYNELGSGQNEKCYQKGLGKSFSKNNMKFKEQTACPIMYNGEIIGRRFLDFLVEEKIIVEIKKGSRFSKSNIDQVLEYLKINDLKLAILINFGNQGVMFKRIVNFS
ncbi:GxxExxY protein [Patescibacteria group bacterium]|nr:GxxExxY protein [Patescibacteria group bacterium]MBU4481296.1 GxxExxY protein [Patescibacteria group bacterium]